MLVVTTNFKLVLSINDSSYFKLVVSTNFKLVLTINDSRYYHLQYVLTVSSY